MRRIENYLRIKRLIESAIADFNLDLAGITVLTEAASGPFVVTSLIAALAGAQKVIAVAKKSRHGSVAEVKEYTRDWANKFEVADSIEVTDDPTYTYANSAELITNLGFVRPIDERLINLLPDNAAISLMWETWEHRDSDVDLAACRKRGIPVLGTCETHPRLQVFRYVGLTVLKLLLETNIEVFKSSILLIGSGHFGEETKKALNNNGADILHLDPGKNWDNYDKGIKSYINKADAIVLVEHNVRFSLLGGDRGLPIEWFAENKPLVIHVCGNIDDKGLKELGLKKVPARKITPGFMAVTTDYVGPRPVIDLHSAGLKVGEALVREMRRSGNPDKAVQFALNNSPAMNFINNLSSTQ